MGHEELRSWICETPFVASEVCLKDGRRFAAPDSSVVSLSGTSLFVAGPGSDEFAEVPVREIERLEPLGQQATDSSQSCSFRAVFARWERLRLWDNLILVSWTLFWVVATLDSFTASGAEPGHEDRLRMLILYVGMGAVVANACFFAGPITVSYVGWLGWRPNWLTTLLFAAGTLFAMLLASVVVLAISAPPF